MRSLLFLVLAACSASSSPVPTVSARVDDVSPSLESRNYADLSITFENPNASDCNVAKYVVAWPATPQRTSPNGEILEMARAAGTKTVVPTSFVVPAKSSIQRRVRIDALGLSMPAPATHRRRGLSLEYS